MYMYVNIIHNTTVQAEKRIIKSIRINCIIYNLVTIFQNTITYNKIKNLLYSVTISN